MEFVRFDSPLPPKTGALHRTYDAASTRHNPTKKRIKKLSHQQHSFQILEQVTRDYSASKNQHIFSDYTLCTIVISWRPAPRIWSPLPRIRTHIQTELLILRRARGASSTKRLSLFSNMDDNPSSTCRLVDLGKIQTLRSSLHINKKHCDTKHLKSGQKCRHSPGRF